ncbi:MAG: NAD+ synthase [Ignavibacteriaceae bacterium]
MKIALCQSNTIIGDIAGNKKRILDGYNKGIQNEADLVILPELALVGYPPLDLVEKKEFRKAAAQAVQEIAAQTGKTGLIFGSITENDENIGTDIHNSAVFCYNGKVQFVQHKSLIPNYDVFDEMRYFEPAKEVYVYEFRGKKLGLSICEDIWNDEDYWFRRRYINDPVQDLIKKGADLLINISASPYSYGKREDRRKMLSVLAGKDKIPLAYVCCAGAQTDLIFDGASMCFNTKGDLVLLGEAYKEEFFMFDTELEYSPVKKVEESFEEEVYNALVFGLKEYVTKQGFSRVTIGLSGGIDSALVTCIAVKALGKQNVHVLLMPSNFSSRGSIYDSKKLIKNLGIPYFNVHRISIQPVADRIKKLFNPVFGSLPTDTTEENIQARTRGLYLMAYSNKFNTLVLTTSNKSEAAVGYSTLYGDMAGGLAVIADVYKTDVYRLADYINREKEIIPGVIITKAPSAELRPDQTDQDSLPPYDVLDKILKLYLEENKEICEIAEITGDRELVEKVLRMVDKNEYKRFQAAPALRVSKKAFGFGRRYPIVQGWRK